MCNSNAVINVRCVLLAVFLSKRHSLRFRICFDACKCWFCDAFTRRLYASMQAQGIQLLRHHLRLVRLNGCDIPLVCLAEKPSCSPGEF